MELSLRHFLVAMLLFKLILIATPFCTYAKEPLIFLVEPKVPYKELQLAAPGVDLSKDAVMKRAFSKRDDGDCDRSEDHCCCGPYFGPFMRDLQKNIKSKWRFSGQEKKRLVVSFKVYKDRTISQLKVSESSGSQKFDERGLRAVRRATIPPLPEDSPSDVDVWFTFESNKFAKHKSKKS